MKMTDRKYKRYPLKSLANFRDLGGYPTNDGGITRYGVFFRSANLIHASAEDLQILKDMGIRKVIDLRYPSEFTETPDACAGDDVLTTINISLMGPITLEEIDVDSDEENTPTLERMYLQILKRCGVQIVQVIRELAKAEHGTLFHCAAGKDRTGLIAMFLLSIAGVEESDVIADYEVSHTYVQRFTSDISGSNYKNMKNTLQYIQNNFETPVNYLLKFGADDEIISALRSRLVE